MKVEEYFLNNCNDAIQTYLTRCFYPSKTPVERLIVYIREHPNKAIKIGKRENATSCKITKSDFLILSDLFPHLVNL